MADPTFDKERVKELLRKLQEKDVDTSIANPGIVI